MTKADDPPLVLLQRSAHDRKRDGEVSPFETDKARHQKLLAFLDTHPLVWRIELPPLLTRTIAGERISAKSTVGKGRSAPTDANLLKRDPASVYPRLGIIDGGVSDAAEDWILDRWDPLADEHMDRAYGTFIAGLTVNGNALNGNVCPETDGVDIVDIAVFPDDDQPAAFEQYYPGGLDDFLDEIGNAVADAKARHDVRIYNFSLNVQHPAEPDQYSSTAARLDRIAETNDSVFFISAGNTTSQDARTEWPADETQALVALATARGDGLLVPAESVRNVSVAALNPPGCSHSIGHMPARYSRRGPGLRAGVKPDLAHFGGSGSPHAPLGHGLFSILPDGTIIDGCGTSYAAPLIAKTAAVLDQSIEGQVSRETLIGLLLHHAEMPEALRSKALSGIARDLVGFGMPPAARQILEGHENKITLVFASRLRVDQQISFGFAWPPSLVTPEGKCRGSAKLTLVSTPPLDRRFGSEFVRVNIDATLQQEHLDKHGNQGWKGRLDPIYLPDSKSGPVIEAERIEHGLKWSPVKCLSKPMPRGIGNSTNWRLFIKYLTRAG